MGSISTAPSGLGKNEIFSHHRSTGLWPVSFQNNARTDRTWHQERNEQAGGLCS